MKTLSTFALLLALAVSLPLSGCWRNSCFAAGTQVDTPDGPVAIEDLEVGDVVWSFDHATGERRAAEVLHTFEHHLATVREMSLADGRVLRVTDEHPIYSAELGRYVEAGELAAGSALVGADGAATLSAWGESEWGVTVYNIEVAGSHNYFAEGVLVHNKSPLEPDAAFFDAGVTSDAAVDASDAGTSDAGGVDAGETDAGALLPVGAMCASDMECASAVCWDFAEQDAACSGSVCSGACTQDDQCIQLAREAGAASPEGARCSSTGCDLVGTGLGVFVCR